MSVEEITIDGYRRYFMVFDDSGHASKIKRYRSHKHRAEIIWQKGRKIGRFTRTLLNAVGGKNGYLDPHPSYPRSRYDPELLSSRFSGNTTQTISPGSLSHAALRVLFNHPVEVALGLCKQKKSINNIVLADMISEYLGREIKHQSRFAVHRLLSAGLLDRDFWLVHERKNGQKDYMIPYYVISEKGVSALHILETGAFYVLRFKDEEPLPVLLDDPIPIKRLLAESITN